MLHTPLKKNQEENQSLPSARGQASFWSHLKILHLLILLVLMTEYTLRKERRQSFQEWQEEARVKRERRRQIRRQLLWFHRGKVKWYLLGALAVASIFNGIDLVLPLALVIALKGLPGPVSTLTFWLVVGIFFLDVGNVLGLLSANLRQRGLQRISFWMRKKYVDAIRESGPYGRHLAPTDVTVTLTTTQAEQVYWIAERIIKVLLTMTGTIILFVVGGTGTSLLSESPWAILTDTFLGSFILWFAIHRRKTVGQLSDYSRNHNSTMSWICRELDDETVKSTLDMNPGLAGPLIAAFDEENAERADIDQRMSNWTKLFINMGSSITDIAYYLDFVIPVGIAFFGHRWEIFAPAVLYTLGSYSQLKISACSDVGGYIMTLGSVQGEQDPLIAYMADVEESQKDEPAADLEIPLPDVGTITLNHFSLSVPERTRKAKPPIKWEEWRKQKKSRVKQKEEENKPVPYRVLLDDVSVTLGTIGSQRGTRQGEICGIVGANEKGKTTLIKLLSRRLRVGDSKIKIQGSLAIGEVDVTTIPRRQYGERWVTYGQQKYKPTLGTVEEAICAGRDVDPSKFEHVVNRLRIKNLKDVFQVGDENLDSGGKGRKIEMARVALRKGEVLIALIDEPTEGLDRLSVKGVIQLLEEMRDEGMRLYIVSHDERITALYDTVFYMPEDGGWDYGTIDDVLARLNLTRDLGKTDDPEYLDPVEEFEYLLKG
jgi:ABC-2 type transport system ATP-binding protein